MDYQTTDQEVPMNILIPHRLLFDNLLPACLTQTWLQLRSLADETGRTVPCAAQQLARLTGKSLPTLYRHLRRLKGAGLLDWRCLASGLQVSFEVEAPAALDPGLPVEGQSSAGTPSPFSNLSDSQNCVCASLNSLKDSLINLTRVEAGFSKSRTRSKTRIQPQKPLKSTFPRCVAPAQPEAPPADDPATLYRQMARLTPSPAQRDLLLQQVHDLPRWRQTLEHWLAHRWNPRNLPGMLDLYQRGGASACRYCPQPEVPKTSQAFEQLRVQYNAGVKPAKAKPAKAEPASTLPATTPPSGAEQHTR
jgi:hypothetical protein